LALLDKQINFPFSSAAFDRAFLALDHNNDVIVGVSSRISLTVLRDLLILPEDRGGFGAVVAVGLPGTRSAGLVLDGESQITAGNVQTLLANAIIVTPR
jgi:hypothetical protein